MRTSWGSPSLEKFGCSTPPRPAAPSPAKLSMEMGTGMRFGKKKLSNRDSPCRRQPWAGRRVLGVKRAESGPRRHKASPLSVTATRSQTSHQGSPPSLGGGAEGVSQTLPGSAGTSPGTTCIQDSLVRLSRTASSQPQRPTAEVSA